jgi:hypothetical protein
MKVMYGPPPAGIKGVPPPGYGMGTVPPPKSLLQKSDSKKRLSEQTLAREANKSNFGTGSGIQKEAKQLGKKAQGRRVRRKKTMLEGK